MVDELHDFLEIIKDQAHLVSIPPDGGATHGHDFGADTTAAEAWATERNDAGDNIYFTTNVVCSGIHKKPTKANIVSPRFAHLDVDPPKDGTPFDIDAVCDILEQSSVPPSFVIFSGNGVQAFWRLKPGATIERTEQANRGLIKTFGGDAGTHNIDRLMRVPGLKNYPNEKKRAAGRTVTQAHLILPDDGTSYEVERLLEAYPAPAHAEQKRESIDVGDVAPLTSVDVLPALAHLIDRPTGVDRSADTFKFACEAMRVGLTGAQVMGVLLNGANAISAHCFSQNDPERAARRAVEAARGEPDVARYSYREDIAAVSRSPDTGRYRLVSAAEATQLPAITWRVKGIVPAEGLVALYGAPGSGKSFLALDLLGAVARGAQWFGNKTSVCPVTYIALEGEAGLSQRVRAYEKRHEPLPSNVRFVTQPLSLLMSQDTADLTAAIIAAGGAGGVICIDTLNRASSGADENDSKDTGRIIESAKLIQRETGGLIILVHHSGKNAANGPRGHSSLVAALDAVIEVTKTEVQRSWKITKSKDGRDDKSGAFHLEIIDLGVDSEGEAITSCVIMPSDDPVRPTKPLTVTNQQGVDGYIRAAKQHGIWRGDQFNGITTEKWRDEFYRTSTSDTADSKRKAFKRLRDALTKLGLLAVDGEINLLKTPATQYLTPPLAVIGEAIAGVLMRDSGTLPGQSRDRSPDS